MDWLNLSISDALKNATAQIPPNEMGLNSFAELCKTIAAQGSFFFRISSRKGQRHDRRCEAAFSGEIDFKLNDLVQSSFLIKMVRH